MSWPPDVIGAAHVITSAASVIRPIANLDRDGAWGGDIARGTGITGSVWAITRITAPVRTASIIRTGPVSRRSSVITAVIVGAPTCTERDRNYEEQDNLPFWSHSRSIPGGEGLHLRVINNVHFHIIDIRIR